MNRRLIPKIDVEVAGNASREELEQLANALDVVLRRRLGARGLAVALGTNWVTTFEERRVGGWLFTADPVAAAPSAERLRGPVVVHGDRTWLFLLRDGERAAKPVVVSGGASSGDASSGSLLDAHRPGRGGGAAPDREGGDA